MSAQSCGIGTRKHAGVRKRNQGNGATADQHREDIAVADPGDCETRQTLRKRTKDRHAVTGPKIKRADDGGRRNYRNQNAWQPLVVLEQQDDHQRAEPNPECDPVCPSFKDCSGDRPQAPQRSFALDREAEELWQLADQNGQCNSVHIAVPYRLGEQLGDKTQAPDAGQNAYRPRNDRHHGSERCGAKRIATRQRNDNAEDDSCQRRVRSQHEDAAGAEQRVDQQRYDRCVQTVDARQARCHRVGNSNRDQHRRQDESSEDIVRKPRRLISTEGFDSRQPVDPMLHWRSLPRPARPHTAPKHQ